MTSYKNLVAAASILILFTSPQLVNAETSIDDVRLLKPQAMTVDNSLDKNKSEQMIRAARLFYTFWNTGDSVYLDEVVASNFIDNTLPKGRPQGPEGLKYASKNFRQAVPDLTCTINDLLIVGNKITARLLFKGTFKGKFMDHPPTNKPIEFSAIDILHIENGRLVEDWHLEDNLTLLQQLDAIKTL